LFKKELAKLDLGLRDYQGRSDAVWDKHRVEEYMRWGEDRSQLKLVELKDLVHKVREEISM
jgi:hypothetical protein